MSVQNGYSGVSLYQRLSVAHGYLNKQVTILHSVSTI